ncbi:MAG: cyclase family protein [Gammaproteobacteria bacterium]
MIEIVWNGRRYRSPAPAASDLAIPLRFDGGGTAAFGAAPAYMEPLASPDFTGRVANGASCNASVLTLAPHGNGTHTECVGHLVEEACSVPELLIGGWMPAWLASVDAAQGAIEVDALRVGLAGAQDHGCAAFILRTLPNGTDKLSRHYGSETPPPWLMATAAQALADAGIEHLLVDLPSLDRLDDPALPAHRAFFGLPAGSRRLREARRRFTTVTELVYAADELADGLYLLDLQIPRWRLEAVPSRPLVVPAELVENSV